MQKLSKNTNKLLLPYFATILAVAIWAGALPVIKITTEYIPPFTFLFIRFLVVCLLLLPVMVVLLRQSPIDRRDYKNLILLGLVGQSAIALVFWGVKFTSALDAAIIGTIAPLLTIAAGHYFYKEKINNTTKVGVLIAVVGMLIVVFEPLLLGNGSDIAHTGTAMQRTFGNLLIVLYNVSFTMYIIWSKMVMGKKSHTLTSTFRHFHVEPMKKTYSPMLHTTIAFYIGLATMIPFAILEYLGYFGADAYATNPSTPGSLLIPILGILYMAILSSIVAYIAYEWGLQKAEVSDGAILGYLGPLFTLPFAFIILGEAPTPINLLGAVVITVGVIIAERNKKALLQTKL